MPTPIPDQKRDEIYSKCIEKLKAGIILKREDLQGIAVEAGLKRGSIRKKVMAEELADRFKKDEGQQLLTIEVCGVRLLADPRLKLSETNFDVVKQQIDEKWKSRRK